MREAIHPLPQYAFMVWCSVKSTVTTLPDLCLTLNLKAGDHSEGLVVDGSVILEWVLGEIVGKVWAGRIWIRIETSGWLL
jgi:hypothetical protein